MKKYAFIAASAVGVAGFIATAYFLRRKRQRTPPVTKRKKNISKQKWETHSEQYYDSPTEHRTRQHSVKSSSTISAGSSPASSIRLKARKLHHSHSDNSPKVLEVKKLYQQGVDSFETALDKWEKATTILKDNPPILHESANIVELTAEPLKLRRCKSTKLSKRKKGKPLPNESVVSKEVLRKDIGVVNALNHDSEKGDGLGVAFSSTPPLSRSENDSEAEDSDSSFDCTESLRSFRRHLDSIVHKAQDLQDDFHESSEYDSDATIGRIDEMSQESDFSDSAESYISAIETLDTNPRRPRRMKMYKEALEAVARGEVSCRKSRAEMLLVDSEEEFLAKVHCLRQGFKVMFDDVTVRSWLIQSTRSMLECIIHLNDLYDLQADEVDNFKSSFDRVIAFCNAEENWENMLSELNLRKVHHTGFYDIILCFLLLDAFNDLENPPYAVTVVLQNRFLANRFKVKAVNAAVWSVLKAKQSQLTNQTGFIAHMYEVCSHVLPTMTWGFLGPDSRLQKACIRFKSEILEYMQMLFNFDHVRYTKPTQMADDILRLTRDRITTLLQFVKVQRREKMAAERAEAYQQRVFGW